MARFSALAAARGISVWQDLLERPLDPVDFFPNYSDRLLIPCWVGQWSNSFQSASYLMIAGSNELKPGASFLAISVDAAHELGGQPGKDQTEQYLHGNTIFGAVKLEKQKLIDRFAHSKRSKQYGDSEQIYFQALNGLKAYGVVVPVRCPQKIHRHAAAPKDFVAGLSLQPAAVWLK
jgi:hypothetical protein